MLPRAEITPTTLANEFGILGTSPAWSEVARAIEILADSGAEPDESFQEQIEMIGVYADMLRHRSQLLAMAIRVGVAVGRVSERSEFNSALYSGMNALRKIYAYGSADALKKLSLAEDELKAFIGDEFQEIGDPNPLDADSLQDWSLWANRLNEVFSVERLVEKTRSLQYREMAWEAWNARLLNQFGWSDETPGSLLAEAICQCRELSPATMLQPDLDSMTLRDWSSCLLAGLRDRKNDTPDYAPGWLALAAAARLGLPLPLMKLLAQIFEAPGSRKYFKARSVKKEREAAAPWLEAVGSLGRSRPLVLLLTQQKSLCDDWRIEPRIAGINLRSQELSRFLDLAPQMPDFGKEFFVVVEQTGKDTDKLREVTKRAREQLMLEEGLNLFNLFPRALNTSQEQPFLVAPSRTQGIGKLYALLREERDKMRK